MINSLRLKFDWKVVTITIVSTLLLMVDFYHPITRSKAIDRTILYFIIPMLIILLIFRENPSHFGFSLGNWKAGLILTVICIILIAPILLWIGKGDPSMKDYYKSQVGGLPWSSFIDLFGWEFLFRGWLLFGYYQKFGPEAIWLQAVPFAMAHIGKPEIETLSTIFGGFIFGWVAWRTKSFIYPFLIHWFVATFIIIVASGLI